MIETGNNISFMGTKRTPFETILLERTYIME